MSLNYAMLISSKRRHRLSWNILESEDEFLSLHHLCDLGPVTCLSAGQCLRLKHNSSGSNPIHAPHTPSFHQDSTTLVILQFISDVFSSVQFSRSGVSNSLHPINRSTPGLPVHHQLPLSWLCHPTISSSVIPFFSCPQSFPASGSFPMSQLFASYGQSIGVSASTSVLPMNTQD